MPADVKSDNVPVIKAAMPIEHCRQVVDDWLLQRRHRQRRSLSYLSPSLRWAACCLRDAVSCFQPANANNRQAWNDRFWHFLCSFAVFYRDKQKQYNVAKMTVDTVRQQTFISSLYIRAVND